MVQVPDLYGGSYCIDATEVTNAHYAAWLETGPSFEDQPVQCDWNESFLPSHDWPPDDSQLAHPVVWVDWCDAAAYCQGTGKRLCGKLGGDNDVPSDEMDLSQNEWLSACTLAGTQQFSYGDTYKPAACNLLEYGADGTIPVGTAPLCEGAYSGVYDLVGNVYEWTHSCDGPAADEHCLLFGGGFMMPGEIMSCRSGLTFGKPLNGVMMGIRCCRDSAP